MAEQNDYNRKIIEEFRANEGEVASFGGATLVILHTIGARTGKESEAPVRFFPQADGSMVIVASAAGRPNNPAWYHNLKAHPRVEIEQGTERYPVVAEEITGPERDTQWERIVAEAPGFGDYQQQTTRVIPLMRLTRVAA
jgi:deazaflavin-dependent oxidoreductase (nitroreductase family)